METRTSFNRAQASSLFSLCVKSPVGAELIVTDTNAIGEIGIMVPDLLTGWESYYRLPRAGGWELVRQEPAFKPQEPEVVEEPDLLQALGKEIDGI